MDRCIEPILFGEPYHHEWDWLWQTMWLAPDFSQRLPYDVGGYCWDLPWYPGATAHPTPSANQYGPAFYYPNVSGGSAYSKHHLWNVSTYPAITGPLGNVPGWTMALGFSFRTLMSSHQNIMAHLYDGVGAKSWKLTMWGGAIDDFRWDYNLGAETFLVRLDEQMDLDRSYTIVVTSEEGNQRTRMYHDGLFVGEAAWAHGSGRWNLLYLAGSYNVKENICFNGDIGPFILSRHAWTADQVSQWASDPYGFMRVDAHPVPLGEGWIDGDFSSELASDGDLASEIASDGTLSAGLAADGDLSSELAADGDFSSELAADGVFSSSPGE